MGKKQSDNVDMAVSIQKAIVTATDQLLHLYRVRKTLYDRMDLQERNYFWEESAKLRKPEVLKKEK